MQSKFLQHHILLISYAKLLQIPFTILSYTTLEYPNGLTQLIHLYMYLSKYFLPSFRLHELFIQSCDRGNAHMLYFHVISVKHECIFVVDTHYRTLDAHYNIVRPQTKTKFKHLCIGIRNLKLSQKTIFQVSDFVIHMLSACIHITFNNSNKQKWPNFL